MRFGKKFICVISVILVFVLSLGMSASAALSPGAKNSEVTAMQKKLIALGYLSGTASGTYDTATKNAVKNFESLNGLPADGTADDEMLAKLDRVYNGTAKIVVTASSLNVRSGAGTRYSKLGAVKKGASYTVLGSKKVSGVTWYSLKYGTKTGWVSGQYVKYTAAQSYITTAKTATITASVLNVRSGAGTKYSKVTSLKKGAVVKVTGSKSVSGTTWYSYSSGGKTLWFCGSYATIKSYIAEKPGTAATTTTTTTTTTAATTTATEAEDTSPTVSSTDTTTTTTTTTATTTTTTTTTTTAGNTAPQKITTKVQFATVTASSLNLRKGAGTSYAKVASASKGSKYAVLGSKTVSGTKWYQILYKGKAVWACGSYLTISTKTATVNRVEISSYATDKPNHLSRTAVINNEADILYSQPGTSNTPLLILQKGVVYDVYGDKGDGDTTWYKLNVNGVEGYISRHNVTITNYYDQVPDRDFSSKTPVIYLSPSKQGANPYIIGNTSEKAEMEALGDVIAKKLEAYDCIVYIAPKDMSLYDRAQHAYSLKADIYIAIHSNASADSSVCYGPSAYYFPGCAQSRQYAQSIVDSLNKIAPKGENLSVQVINGMNLAGGFGYAEVRDPGTLGMIGVLVETDYHDYKPTAQWLINEKDLIADAYVESIVNAFGLRLKEEPSADQSPTDITPPAETEPEAPVVISPTDTVSASDIVSDTDAVSTSDAA